jgi:class 3 adenylate cyclase
MDFEEKKSEIIDIITSKTDVQKSDTVPASDEQFTFDNGIKTWVTALFVDIRDSTSFFKGNKEDTVARVIRAFSQGIIEIMSADANYREIGIRGDCVYGIYTTPHKNDFVSVFDHATEINSFLKLLNHVLKKNSFPTFTAGIGIGAAETLVIKAGKKGAGISDKVWIGNSVVDAANLSGIAKKFIDESIAMDETFYINVIDILKEKYPNCVEWFRRDLTQNCYCCDVRYLSVDDCMKD